MPNLPKVKIGRRIYSYSSGILTSLGDFTVETEEYRKDEGWPDTLNKEGYKGAGVGDDLQMRMVGGLSARVYRRATPGQTTRKESIFAQYDFVVDVDATYMVVIREFLEFLQFSKEYLIAAEIDGVDSYDVGFLKDALSEIRDVLYGVQGIMENYAKRSGPARQQR